MFAASILYKRSNIANILANSRKYSISRVNFARTHYEVLGIEESSTDAEIKEAYYKKMKLLHPDKNAQNSRNHQISISLNEAYAVLGKRISRENYDVYLKKLRHQSSHNNHRAIFRDQDHFYEDTIDRRRSYEHHFHQSKGKFYEEKPYYGIKGVNRVSNIRLASIVIAVMILFHIFFNNFKTTSTRYCLDKLREKDEEARQIYEHVRENALNNDMEEQLELLRLSPISKDPIKFHEELSKRREEFYKNR